MQLHPGVGLPEGKSSKLPFSGSEGQHVIRHHLPPPLCVYHTWDSPSQDFIKKDFNLPISFVSFIFLPSRSILYPYHSSADYSKVKTYSKSNHITFLFILSLSSLISHQIIIPLAVYFLVLVFMNLLILCKLTRLGFIRR